MIQVRSVLGLLLALLLLLTPFALVEAQVVTTPYWCGSSWSSYPCSSSWYGSSYGYPYSYGSYYPYNSYNYSPYSYGYQYNYPTPTCAISISYPYNTSYYGQYQYGYHNQEMTLSWSSNNATSAHISGIGNVQTSGSKTVYPGGYMTYTMTVSGPGGSNTCQTSYTQPYYYNNYNYYNNQYQYPYMYNYPYNYGYQYNYNYPYYY